VLELGLQIASGLAAAHAKGIVHRDLKPANVKLTADGRVKVLDFGLAKAFVGDDSASSSSTGLSHSPTLARGGTLAGVILGTAGYMSPEQASGGPVDKRADIWSFGVVLFEMLTGERLFAGETPSEVLASVIKEEPPWERLPSGCPGPLVALLRRCLRKRPRERLQDIGDARLELSELGDVAVPASGTRSVVGRTTSRRRAIGRWLALAADALIGGAVGALFFRARAESPEAALPARFLVEMPSGASVAVGIAVSPDGRFLALSALPQGGAEQTVLWMKPLDSRVARALPGTEGAVLPFWSPDSGSVGFFVGADLKTIRLSTGSVQKVCTLPSGFASPAAWSSRGTIVAGSGWPPRLYSVPDSGGEPKDLTGDLTGLGLAEGFPQFLPDGQRMLFSVLSSRPEAGGLYEVSLDPPGKPRRVLTEMARYASPGRLLFVRDGTLLAQPFDETRLVTTGQRTILAEDVESLGLNITDSGNLSTSGNLLLYVSRPNRSSTQLAWFDRGGKRLEDVGKPAPYGQLVLAPDQQRIAVEVADAEGRRDIWVIELGRGVASRITFDPADELDPVWAPSSRELAYSVWRGDPRWDVLRKSLLSNAPASELLRSPVPVFVKSWSGDGKTFVYVKFEDDKYSKYSVWVLHPDGDAKPEELFRSHFNIEQPQLSPDGRWLSYLSSESGTFEVYIQPFPGGGERVRVSTEGGGQPLWRRDGRELYYLSPDGRLMAVALKPAAGRLEVGRPAALFPLGRFAPDFFDYAPSADGQRFLVKVPVGNAGGRSIHAIVNWQSLLR
jgi:Tol biopolymer transport system component